MNTRATNFSYFLPRHVYNSIETRELYPPQTRPSDPELSVDKAMTMLNIAEDQIAKLQAAEPFNPTDFGFEEKEVGGENEFDAAALYIFPDNSYWISPGEKAMTWEISKIRRTDHGDGIGSIGTDWEITAFIPNKLTGAILLQSLNIIDLVNPEGVYTSPVLTEQEAPKETIDRNQPVLVFSPKNWTDPKEMDAFLLENSVIDENGSQTRLAMFLTPEALNAMRQIRFLIQERNDGRQMFEGVENAIDEHPNFSPEQKEKMQAEWKGSNQNMDTDTIFPIFKTEEEYKAGLARFEEIFLAEEGTVESAEADELSRKINAYEAEHFGDNCKGDVKYTPNTVRHAEEAKKANAMLKNKGNDQNPAAEAPVTETAPTE